MTAFDVAAARERSLLAEELQDAWPVLSAEERLEGLRLLTYGEAEDFLLSLPARDQAELILATNANERRSWMRLLPPDDAADVVQEAPEAEREGLLAVLDEPTRKEVAALLAYAEDDAGGLMNPRYARLRRT
jgi:magnesium transporter